MTTPTKLTNYEIAAEIAKGKIAPSDTYAIERALDAKDASKQGEIRSFKDALNKIIKEAKTIGQAQWVAQAAFTKVNERMGDT